LTAVLSPAQDLLRRDGIGADAAGPSGADLGYSWAVVAVLMVLYTCSFVDRTILNLMVGPIRAGLGISDTQFSYLTGFAFVVMYSIAAIPFGWVVDRWSRRALIALGVTAWSVMTAMCGFASSFAQLFAARVGVGVGEASLSPAAYSLVSDYFPRQALARARALSVFGLGVPIGSGFAMVIGGPLVQSRSPNRC
jgi:MFS family permease